MGIFQGQNALITGASRGVGAVIAKHFAKEGARVVVVAAHSADDTLKAIKAQGGHASFIQCDVTKEDQVVSMAGRALKELDDKVDMLINVAGMNGFYQLVKDAKLADWQHVMQVNFFGTMMVTREFLPSMMKRKAGRIIITSSNCGKRGLPIRGDYVATKWALIGFTQTLALEMAPYNIRVNAVCPGPIEGDRIEQVMESHSAIESRSKADVRTEWEQAAPMKRFVTPEEVASVTAFLCSDASSAMTGQSLNVTGGFIMH